MYPSRYSLVPPARPPRETGGYSYSAWPNGGFADPRAVFRILRAHHGEKPNLTGFDVRKYAHAAGQPRYDPWERA